MNRRTDSAAAKAAAEANKAAEGVQLQPEHAQLEPSQPKDEAPRERPPREKSDHELSMESVRKRRGEPVDEPPAPKAEEPKVEAKAEPAPAPEPSAPVFEAPPPVETVKVKVDGEEFMVPKTEVEDAGGLKAYQINRASENRYKKLQEEMAADRKARQEQHALMQQMLQGMAPKPNPQQAKQEIDAQLAAKLDVIRFGTPEEGIAALNEIVQSTVKPVDQQALVTQATQRAMSEWEYKQALDKFSTEYQDILANPWLNKMVTAEAHARLPTKSAQTDWLTYLSTIGNEVRTAFMPKQTMPTAQGSAASASPTSGLSERDARKASNITTLPTASARAALPKEEREETREERLNAMRKARGQLDS